MIKKNQRNTIILTIGLVFLVLSVIWYSVIGAGATQIDSDYSVSEFLIHNDNTRFEIGGDWDGETIASTSVIQKISEFDSSLVELKRDFKVETLDGELIYSINQEFLVDTITRKTVKAKDDEVGGIFAFFPKDVEKKEYNVYIPGFGDPIHFTFNKTARVKGIDVYHFQAKNQESNDTSGYEFLDLVPSTYNAISVFTMDIYVEPKTGLIIDYEDTGITYYVDKDTNEKTWAMDQWGNAYSDATIERKIALAETFQQDEQLNALIIPLVLLIIGLILIIVSIMKKKQIKEIN